MSQTAVATPSIALHRTFRMTGPQARRVIGAVHAEESLLLIGHDPLYIVTSEEDVTLSTTGHGNTLRMRRIMARLGIRCQMVDNPSDNFVAI